MHGVLDRFFRLASDELERFGCEVHRHLGDGFMTVLGLPRAIEDHAERGVLAGLAVRDRVERELLVAGDAGAERVRVRIGIESGTLVVAPLGDDDTAVGDTANVAARLQALAEPGQVLIGETTARLLPRAGQDGRGRPRGTARPARRRWRYTASSASLPTAAPSRASRAAASRPSSAGRRRWPRSSISSTMPSTVAATPYRSPESPASASLAWSMSSGDGSPTGASPCSRAGASPTAPRSRTRR